MKIPLAGFLVLTLFASKSEATFGKFALLMEVLGKAKPLGYSGYNSGYTEGYGGGYTRGYTGRYTEGYTGGHTSGYSGGNIGGYNGRQYTGYGNGYNSRYENAGNVKVIKIILPSNIDYTNGVLNYGTYAGTIGSTGVSTLPVVASINGPAISTVSNAPISGVDYNVGGNFGYGGDCGRYSGLGAANDFNVEFGSLGC